MNVAVKKKKQHTPRAVYKKREVFYRYVPVSPSFGRDAKDL